MLSNGGVAIKQVHEGWCWGGSTVCRHTALGEQQPLVPKLLLARATRAPRSCRGDTHTCVRSCARYLLLGNCVRPSPLAKWLLKPSCKNPEEISTLIDANTIVCRVLQGAELGSLCWPAMLKPGAPKPHEPL